MFTGLYAGATALDYLNHIHHLTSTNLAHVNTSGFHKTNYTLEERSKDFKGLVERPGAFLENQVDFKTPGRLEETGNPLDVALQGDGFFQLEGDKEPIYTRNGQFSLNAEGVLVNHRGFPVAGEGGQIQIPIEVSLQDVAIQKDGTVRSGDQVFGKIKIVSFDNPQLLKSDSQVDFLKGKATIKNDSDSLVIQGRRRLSNAQPVTELINLIVASRQLEAAQRAIRTISETIEKSLKD